MEMEELVRTFGLLVVAGVLWVLILIFAVIRGFFKEMTVLLLFMLSAGLGASLALLNLYAVHGSFSKFEFLYYFVFWWVALGALMTIVPAILHIRRGLF